MLETVALTRRFGATLALDAVDLRLERGEVLAIVGENGAGKSTLVKVLGGVYRPDSGRIAIDGQPLALHSPAAAGAAGIHVIHQDRQLVPQMSGMENLFLSLPYPRRGFLVDWRAMRERAERALAELQIRVPLDRPLRELSPAEAALLEIARAFLAQSRILILDEPTASLTEHEAGILFALVRRLRARGVSFIYVSHRLEEVLEIADRIGVLRNGRVAGEVRPGETTSEGLVALITGRGVAAPRARAYVDARDTPPLLEVRDLATRDGRVRSASFALHPGEILGVFGLAGSGRTELLEAIVGLRARLRGAILLRGAPIGRAAPHLQRRRGIAMIGEDRRTHGLLPRHSVRHNMTLQTIGRHSRFGLIRRRSEARAVHARIAALDIRGDGIGRPIETLSGGNQQKVLLARMLLADPEIVLCDEPTHAVDVGTRARIHELLAEQARAGRGVLFISSDLGEVLELADRILLMSGGRTVAEAPHGELDAGAVMRICYAEEERRRA